MQKYDPKLIESKWQKFWEKNKLFEVSENSEREKFYGLIEFPYPSGAGLHVGHPRPFTAMDVICRKKRMQGKNVLFPIGFDAFGLPTENFAIKTGRPPAEVTAENIANFTRQLKMLGYGFAWDRAVDTTDPKYYKWTQWIFLQFFKHGLAYKKAMPINWCPSCKIGLANEEVVDGNCERCGTPVEKRNKEQWMLSITKYADKLLQGLETVDYIPQAKIQQQNWIGRSEGALVRFNVVNVQGVQIEQAKRLNKQSDTTITTLEVFTTRPDTLFGATYCVIAPEHQLIADCKLQISNFREVEQYVDESKKKTDQERSDISKEKTGVEIKGLKVMNPVNGEELPIYVADYVLGGYGTGAIMAVPAHDERDFEFAKKYDLPIKEVVSEYLGKPGMPNKWKRGTYALVKNDDKYLILRDKTTGIYRLPGGTQESGETDIQTLTREISEEIGYEVFNTRLLGHVCSKTNEEGVTGHCRLGFLVDAKKKLNGDRDGEDNYEVKWLTFSEAHKAFENNYFNTGEQKILEFAENGYSCFSGDGLSINSDFLNNLKTPEAKEKIIQYLEEKGVGKRKIQYKLRDWVFSRQRYWGEPIPLVFCENCAERNKKQETRNKKVVLIHGICGHAQENWFPWLKTELEQIDYEVFIPNLPNADYPELSEWVNELCKLPINSTDEVVVIGHSLGGPAACKFVEQKNIKIKKLILISPTGTEQEKDWSGLKAVGLNEKALECIHNFNSAEKDWGKIKNLTEESVIYMSDNDPFIPLEVRNDYKDLQAKIKDFSGKGHFNRKVGMTKFEAILSEFNYGEKLNAGWIPLSESELPLELPKVKKYEPTDTGESPLAAMTDWVKTKCPVCGGEARRETDTMPNWAGSSWYFLAYTMSRNHKSKIINHKSSEFVWDRKTIDYWNPVDWYNGGMEHTVLHLLYSRFWNQFLFDLGLVPTLEPYKKRTSHGMILAADGEKMSKSRGNVINPDEMVERFGTDAFRTYIMFMGPFDQAVAWDTNGLVGVRRFLDKVWGLQEKIKRSEDQKIIVKTKLETLLHQTIKKVSEDIEAMRFNTAVAQLMILVNEMSKEEQISPISYLLLLQLLSPFAPHMAEELWAELGNKDSICLSEWPEYDRELIVDDEITVVCQVNGKVRDEFKVPVGITEEEIKKLVLESEKVQKWLEGKEPKKIIYVKSKLVSVVV